MSTAAPTVASELSRGGRWAVLAAAFLGLVFDGFELGLMPVASNSVAKSLLATSEQRPGRKMVRLFHRGADARSRGRRQLARQSGRSHRPRAGDGRKHLVLFDVRRPGRVRDRRASKCLILRFMVGLGVGGMWPNGVALVAECWPNTSRPTVAGVFGAGINVGIVGLSHSGKLCTRSRPIRGVGFSNWRQFPPCWD